METKARKILIVLIFIIVALGLNTKDVYAAEASVSANNCNVGDVITVTLNVPSEAIGFEGNVTVAYSDGSKDTGRLLGLANSPTQLAGNKANFTAKVSGNATITISGLNLYNANGDSINSNKTLTTAITINGASNSNDNNSSGNEQKPPAENNNNSGTTTSKPPESNNSGNNQGSSDNNKPAEPPAKVTNIEFAEANEKMYTTRRVNVRQGYGTSSSIIQTLAPGTEVTRTGVGKGNVDGYAWSRISYNGVTGYMITGALTYDAPVNPDEEKPNENPDENQDDNSVENPDENTPSEENPDSLSEEEMLAKIAEELGVIPEVGINIMPCIFVGCVISCTYLMYEIKRRMK